MSDTDRAIREIAREKTDIESRMPQGAEPGSTEEAYAHGRWRGLKFAIEVLLEERSDEGDTE